MTDKRVDIPWGTYEPPAAPWFDPESPSFRQDPYPVYRRMLATTPVWWQRTREDPRRGAWYVFRHADVSAALRDGRLTRQAPSCRAAAAPTAQHEAMGPYIAMRRRWVLYSDPPEHTRRRSAITHAFTPALMAALRTATGDVADELLTELRSHAECDLMAEFATLLPARIIESLLGVDERERARFRTLAEVVATAMHVDHRPASYTRAAEAALALTDLLRDTLHRRRDDPRLDLISGMVHPRADGPAMSDDEVIANSVLLLLAGQETTTNLIGNGIQTLLEHPSEAERLREDPALEAPAIEEILRYESPAQMTDRFATEELSIGGERIACGDQLWLVLGAANRDPAVYLEPHRFSIACHAAAHRAFGLGVHHCLGAELGRMEGTIAIGGFVRRFPDAALVEERPAWRPSRYLRGLSRLRVRLRG